MSTRWGFTDAVIVAGGVVRRSIAAMGRMKLASGVEEIAVGI